MKKIILFAVVVSNWYCPCPNNFETVNNAKNKINPPTSIAKIQLNENSKPRAILLNSN